MVRANSLAAVMSVYEGSNGDATRKLYATLESCGPLGAVAMNLMRAQKNSARAKVYRGGNDRGSYRSQAYERKTWAIGELAKALSEHGKECGIEWGWGEDQEQPVHRWVLYVELPNGQVSFHTIARTVGPDAPKPWDGKRDVSPQRICAFVASVLDQRAAA